MAKYLDSNGLAYFWSKVKAAFATKQYADETMDGQMTVLEEDAGDDTTQVVCHTYEQGFSIVPLSDIGGGGGSPTGSITMFAGSSAPSGWMLCQGQAVSRTTYSALFSVIGTTYGAGNGSTTFNLPDLQGKFPLGKSSSHALASTGGAETHTLTTDEMPAHTHKASNYVALTGWQGDSPGFFLSRDVQGGSTASGPQTGSAGGGQAHSIMPPFVTVNYIIKA